MNVGGSISGHVYKADGVTVITDTVIRVKAHCVDPGNCSYGAYASQSDGSYTINGLAPGTLKVQANSQLEPGYVTEFYNDQVAWNEAEIIEVVAGQTTANIDFALAEDGRITGSVYEADGATPVENACVDVTLTAPNWNEVLNWCCTDQNGQYTLNSLAAGSYYLKTQANCQGANSGLQDEWYAASGSTPDGNQATTVDVLVNQTTSNVDFNLDDGGGISGRVFKADGVTPISSAWVYALDTDFRFVAGDHSQPDGSYQINGLPPEQYYVAVRAAGYGGVYYDNGYDDPHATLADVVAPNNTPNVDFRLSPEATLSGYVYQNDGATPLAGAKIQVWPQMGGQIRNAVSISDGSYSVGGLSTGYYVANVEASDYAPEFYEDTARWSTATPIWVEQPGDTSNINFLLGEAVVSATIQPDSGGTVTSTTNVTTSLTFPPNAVSEPVTTTFKITSGYTAPSGFNFLGHTFSIEAHTANGTPVTTFSESFTVTIYYDENDVPTNMDETDLKLYYWNESLHDWEEVPSSIDTEANTLIAVLDHLTTFAAMGKTSAPPVYLPIILRNH